MLEANSMNDSSAMEITPEFLAQNPWLAIAISAVSLLIVTLLVGAVASWIVIGMRVFRGQTLLAPEPWTPRVWGLADLLMVAVFLFGSQTLLASVYSRWAGLEMQEGQTLPLGLTTVASFGNLLTIGLTLLWLAMRYGVGPGHVGFRISNWSRQLKIGVLATFACLPIVYLLMAAVSSGLESEYKHPLLEEIKSTATLASYLLGFVTAVILAPIGEEFLFRVMIQGWMQSIVFSSPVAIVLGASQSEREAEQQSQYGSQLSPSSEIESTIAERLVVNEAHVLDPYESPIQATIVPTESPVIPPIWPSVVTGVLFGLAHWGYGLSFIPLILLGTVLGLLYRATHSIWPCVMMHCVLNGTSMLGLGVYVLNERAVR